MRERRLEAATGPLGGLACEQRNTLSTPQLVWAPMTTCFAHDKFGIDCSGGGNPCSVDGAGGLIDGLCIEDSVCSYYCESSDWCPESSQCGTSLPYDDRCVP